MFKRSQILITAVVVLFVAGEGQSQIQEQRQKVPTARELRVNFRNVLDGLLEVKWEPERLDWLAAPEDARSLGTAVSSCRRSVDNIFESTVEFAPPFLGSLNVSYVAVMDLSETRRAEKRVSSTLFARVVGAADDLNLKAESLKKNRQSLLKVTVRTLKPGTTTEVNGCYVWYAPLYDDRESNWDRFGRISSPTGEALPPGSWKIWARKGNKSGKSETLKLTNHRDFDIDAPEE